MERKGWKFSQVVKIALERPSYSQWQHLITTHGLERSHLCHNNMCEQPYHSMYESHQNNIARGACMREYLKLVKNGKRAESALKTARSRCNHNSKCWPSSTIPRPTATNITTVMLRQFEQVMRTSGYCKECGLDLPVKLDIRPKPVFSRTGRTDGAVATKTNIVEWFRTIANPNVWFDAFQQQYAQIHLGLSKGTEIWAGK
jgi:hypothetical protein